MKVVAFVSFKGGVGVTTLAYNTAIHASKRHTVFLADLDPAQALTIFARKRKDGSNPMLLEDAGSIGRAVENLTSNGFGRDYLIVDAPKAFVPVIRDAVAAADCIVLPIEPSPVDVLVNEEAVDLVRKMGKLDRALLVVNSVDGRSSIGNETLVMIDSKTPHRPVKISHRVDYKRSLIGGLAAFEINAAAEVEIGALWDAIQHVMRKADHENVQNGGREARAGET
jgi:chromosome partitioning protein